MIKSCENIETCPICREKLAEYFTECNHKYCINCLSKIKKCAICRKTLLREQLCLEITENSRRIFKNSIQSHLNFVSHIISIRESYLQLLHDIEPSGTCNFQRVDESYKNLIVDELLNNYKFNIGDSNIDSHHNSVMNIWNNISRNPQYHNKKKYHHHKKYK